MNRKAGVLILAGALIISLLFGCKSKPTSLSPSPQSSDGFAKLSDYPEDLLPLFKCDKVTYGLYEEDYRDVDPFFGPNFYEIHYVTTASKKDALNFYGNLVVEKNDTVFEDSVFGKMSNGHMIQASVNEVEDGSLEVSLTLGMEPLVPDTSPTAAAPSPAPTDAVNNPYFSGFQMPIEALGGRKNTLYSKSYEKTDEGERCERRFITYTSQLTMQEFRTLYQQAYGAKKNFTVQDTDYSLTFRFEDNGIRYSVYLTKPQEEEDEQFLTIVMEQ